MVMSAKDFEAISESLVPLSIGKTIRQLMSYSHMTEADLCRGVNLPQTTINRLLSGQTNDPRISILIAVAQFFDISLEQLLGQELLILDSVWKHTKGLTIPVLDWKFLSKWFSNSEKENCKIERWIKTEKLLSKNSFAIVSPVSCYSVFGEKSVLIMNCIQDQTVEDGQIVLLEDPVGEFCLRKVFKEGNTVYLKRLFAPFEVISASDSSIFRAYVVESRNDRFLC